jgi:hypothetical protein
VLNVEYHVSKYTQIIAQLRNEIQDLKYQLKSNIASNGGPSPNNMLPPISREPAFNAEQLERLKDELNTHFAEEIKAKKRVHELEQKMETGALSVIAKKNELAQIIREKGSGAKDSIQVKIINEEVEETQNQIAELKKNLDSTNQRVAQLLKRREQFSQEWKQSGAKEIALEVLNHVMRENTILVENMEFSRREQKADLQIKIKEMQFSKLQEQIKVRDEMLAQARRRYKVEGLEYDIEDPRMIQIEELMQQSSLFPPISNATYGKATGNMIKSLLSNISGATGNSEEKKAPTQRRQQNNGLGSNSNLYHSLPPIGPNRDQSESRIPKPKYVLQPNFDEKNRANINFKELREASHIGQPKRQNHQQQLSVNSRIQNYALNGKQNIANNNFSQPYGQLNI